MLLSQPSCLCLPDFCLGEFHPACAGLPSPSATLATCGRLVLIRGLELALRPLPCTSRTFDLFRLSNFFPPAPLAVRGGGSYMQMHDLHWHNSLTRDLHRPACAGGCDPLATAWIKLAAACATAKNSRGLLTVTSFCFCRSTVSGFCGASHCCQHLAHFRSTLLPASRGCRFQHCI